MIEPLCHTSQHLSIFSYIHIRESDLGWITSSEVTSSGTNVLGDSHIRDNLLWDNVPWMRFLRNNLICDIINASTWRAENLTGTPKPSTHVTSYL